MKESLLKTLCFVTGASLVFAAGACGQNTTIHRGEILLDKITEEAKIPNPEELSPNDPSDEESTPQGPDLPGDDGSTGSEDLPGDDGSTGSEDLPGNSGPTETVVIYRAGGYEKTIDAEPLDDEEFRELDLNTLPYISTMDDPRGPRYRHLMPLVNLGTRWSRINTIPVGNRRYNLGQHTPYLQGRRPTIKDAQVIFKLPFRNLPPRNTLEDWDPARNDRASLHMIVSKVSHEGSRNAARQFMNTEVLCFLGVNWCSGSVFTADNWQGNINPAFFENGRRPENENTYFNEQFLTEHEVHGNRLYFYGGIVLPFDELLKRKSDNTQVMSVLDLIYGNTPPDQPLIYRALYIVVADDTYISKEMTHLRMRFRVKDGAEVVIRPEPSQSAVE